MANTPHSYRQRVVIGDHAATLTAGRDDLVLPEAKTSRAPDRPHLPAAVHRAMRLRRVLDDGDSSRLGKRQQSIHLRRVPAMIALVRSVIRSATLSGEKQNVRSSTSPNTGVARW